VGEFFHHSAGYRNRVFVALQTADSAGPQRSAIHDAGIQLDLAEKVGETAEAHCVVVGVTFDEAGSRFDNVKGRAAMAQQLNGRR
jgi:hypothetical protein